MMAAGNENFALPHGYEYEFVSPVEKRFLCVICELPFKDAVQTKCGHKFCRDCLVESLRRTKNLCPLDRKLLNLETDVFSDLSTQREIKDLHVKCESKECDWVGELREAETHLEECTNENCQMRIPRLDIENHVKNECEWRLVRCAYCGVQTTKREEENHQQRCCRFPLRCVNGCEDEQIPRSEMQDHVDDSCPLTFLPCLFRYIGCNEKIERRNFDHHMEASMGHHLRLACDKLMELELTQREEIETREKAQLKQERASQENKIALEKIEKELIPKIQRRQNEIGDAVNQNKKSEQIAQETVIPGVQEELRVLQEDINQEKVNRRNIEETKIPELTGRLEEQINELKIDNSLFQNSIPDLQESVRELREQINREITNQGNIQEKMIATLHGEFQEQFDKINKLQEENKKRQEEINESKRRCLLLAQETKKMKEEFQQAHTDNLSSQKSIEKKVTAAKNEATDFVRLKFRNFKSVVTSELQDQIKNELQSEAKARSEAVKVVAERLELIKDKQNKLYVMSIYNKFIWPMHGFEIRRAKGDDMYSLPFYSWDHGYKLMLNVCPNGNRDGEGSHLSVYVVVTKGEYDAILPWPFNGRVQVTLLSQQPAETDHWERIIDFSTAPANSTERPGPNRSVEWGLPKFLSHNELKDSPYLVDDTIFLQARVLE